MKSPELVRIYGNGRFSNSDISIQSSFSLLRTSRWIGILTKKDLPIWGTFRLCGTLRDGRTIRAKKLCFTQTRPGRNTSGCELTALEGVYLGQGSESSPAKSRYPLTGFFEGDFSLTYNGWDFSSIPCPDPAAMKTLARKWHYPVEGATLEMKNLDATPDQHHGRARTIMLLLSLAAGTGVACDRQFLIWPRSELEVWRQMTGDEIGPGPIIPTFAIGSFLKQSLPSWELLPVAQQNAFRMAVSYINLSANGYLDTKLFHALQPWELLSKAWGMKGELSEPIKCLRTRLNTEKKRWNKEYPESDPDGFWGTRISSVFDWPRLLYGITQLSNSFGLDLERIGLDITQLKKARDSVAHCGNLPAHLNASVHQAVHLLSQSQSCLQLLLLRILDYRGPVCHASNGWKTVIDIGTALTMRRS